MSGDGRVLAELTLGWSNKIGTMEKLKLERADLKNLHLHIAD